MSAEREGLDEREDEDFQDEDDGVVRELSGKRALQGLYTYTSNLHVMYALRSRQTLLSLAVECITAPSKWPRVEARLKRLSASAIQLEVKERNEALGGMTVCHLAFGFDAPSSLLRRLVFACVKVDKAKSPSEGGEMGALSMVTSANNTVLHYAAGDCCDFRAFKELVEACPELRGVTNGRGMTPYDAAVDCQRMPMIVALLEY